MHTTMKHSSLAALAIAVILPAVTVRADSPTQGQQGDFHTIHPRRAEANTRLRHRRAMLDKDLKSGKITRAQYDAEVAKLNSGGKEAHGMAGAPPPAR